MAREPGVIWADLDAKLAEVATLQSEMNGAVVIEPPPLPVDPPVVQGGAYQLGVLPEAKRIIGVSNLAQLQDKLKSAVYGDRIEAEPGEYNGAINMEAHGLENWPIIIHAPKGGVIFPKIVYVKGRFCGVSGIKFKDNGRKVDISNVGGRVMRCEFEKIDYDGSVYMTGTSHPKAMIDFNKWSNITGAAIRSEILNGSKHQDMVIAYNHILGHSIKGDNESVMLILMDAYHDMKLQILNNRFEECCKGYEKLGQSELITIKTTDILLKANTICKSKNVNFSFRVSNKVKALNNWLRDGAFLSVCGDDHYIENNDAGTGKVIQLNAGDCNMDTPTPSQCRTDPKVGRCPVVYDGRCKGGHASVRRTTLKNNKGRIFVGNRYGTANPVKLVDITLVNNSEKASVTANSVTNFKESGIGQNTTTAKEMTAAMVGPNAQPFP